MILTDLRNDVRTYLDVDAEDLPDQLLARWAKEASNRIMSATDHWPFFEYDWTFDTVASQSEYSFDSLATGEDDVVDELYQLVRSTGTLRQIPHAEARRRYSSASNSGTPYLWSVRRDEITLWPTPTAIETITVIGWRKPMAWVDGENGYVSDFPEEFDDVIFNYVLGKAYVQQEDPDMGLTHMDLADEILRRLVRRKNDWHGEPIVIGSVHQSSGSSLTNRLRYDWE